MRSLHGWLSSDVLDLSSSPYLRHNANGLVFNGGERFHGTNTPSTVTSSNNVQRGRRVSGMSRGVPRPSLLSQSLSCSAYPLDVDPRSSLLPGPSTGNPSPLFCTLMQSSYTTRRQKESPPQWLHWHVDSDDSVSINQLGRLHSQRDPYVGSRTRLSEVAVGPSGVTTPSLDFDPSAKTSVVQTSGTSAFIFK